jgi:hypothetical protein
VPPISLRTTPGSRRQTSTSPSTMSQQSRRRDPYPSTWEIPLGILFVILMVLACGVHLGRSIANVLAGAGWAFPTRVELFRSLPAVVRGDAAAGLDGPQRVCAGGEVAWRHPSAQGPCGGPAGPVRKEIGTGVKDDLQAG